MFVEGLLGYTIAPTPSLVDLQGAPPVGAFHTNMVRFTGVCHTVYTGHVLELSNGGRTLCQLHQAKYL